MNKDEADRCLQISKEKYRDGHTDAAVKFAKKSLALCQTDNAEEWLAFVTKMGAGSGSKKPAAAATSKDHSGPRKRTATTDSSADSDAPPARPYTAEQVAGIKRIKAIKGKGDLYEILGLKKGCDDAAIKKAYRKLALQFHPDKCGAPGTDEAFKAIGHAFAVLGDADKRAKYDRYGIDSDSRGGGGGGGGGGGFAGFGGPQFESEISPEDLFNMFFGDMGGSGMRMHSFTSGPGFRQNSFRRPQRHHHQNQQQAPQSQLMQFIHLLPVLFIFVFPLISALFSGLTGDNDPQPTFNFVATASHNQPRTTGMRHVQYYVNPRTWARWKAPRSRPDDLRKFDQAVEGEYYRDLRQRCAQEQEHKAFNIRSAHGWFTVDQKRLRAAQKMPTPKCDELRSWQ
ncbi:hypothetical protein HDU88_004298 [Geranomyces variabilis]|nr:hypothetical protein HDU88_004298 [Geranomyces variabilis]